MPTLKIEAGEQTEGLVQFVTQELDDATLDQIDVQREIAQAPGLASEPITTAVTIVLGTAVIASVLRLVERWLENQRQLATLTIVADVLLKSEEAGKQLASLAEKHTNVSVSYGLAQESWKKE